MKSLTNSVREGDQIPFDIPPSGTTTRIIVKFQKRKGQDRIIICADPEVIAANLIDVATVSGDNL